MSRAAARPRARWLLLAVAFGFLAGVLVTTAVVGIAPQGGSVVANNLIAASVSDITVRPSLSEAPTSVTMPAAAPETEADPSISADPIEDRRQRHLTLPLLGITRDQLRDTFNENRSGSRRHEALDVLAPRNTPVVAVEDGKVARLFLSQAGGITVYQFDPTETYVYYYAHLERYAAGLHEGDVVQRGQVIGYVGSTGNASPDTPHLHFAIFKMTDEKKWWQGTPIDLYLVFK